MKYLYTQKYMMGKANERSFIFETSKAAPLI